FQAEDGIRDRTVTGVQTCALPICLFAAMSMAGLNVSAQTTQSVDKPQITNAKLEQRNVKASLAEEVDEWVKSAERPQWLGYAVRSEERRVGKECRCRWRG